MAPVFGVKPELHINTVSVSGGFPTLRNPITKGKKRMAKKSPTYRVVIKDGTTDYKYDAKTGSYTSKVVDSVNDFDTLAEALAEFLFSIDENVGSDRDKKVTLTHVPANKK